ncbi:MAG: hypothetical protein ACYCV7_04525 [Acidimicrobiales bacterium]
MVAQVPMMAAGLSVSTSRDAVYDIVLLAHVLAAMIGFGAVGVAGIYAVMLGLRGPASESVERYYRPGVNWAGRIIVVVPVLGFVLLGMNSGPGGYSVSDGWVVTGLILWTVAAVAAEMVLWPTERRLQQLVTKSEWDISMHRSLWIRAASTSGALMVIFLTATVVMVAKP